MWPPKRLVSIAYLRTIPLGGIVADMKLTFVYLPLAEGVLSDEEWQAVEC